MGHVTVGCKYCVHLVQIISSWSLLMILTGPGYCASCSPTHRLMYFLTARVTTPDTLAGIRGTASGNRSSNVASKI